MPATIDCPDCDGHGCDECNKRGSFDVTACPNQYVGDIRTAIPLMDLFENGLPPVSGGTLDQAAWFLSAVRTLQHEEAAVEAADHEDV